MSKFQIKDNLDRFIYKTYNILSNIHFYLFCQKKVIKKNIKFKNKHLGERCFILGTGPSLKYLDYKLLKNEIIIGVNFLYKGEIIKHLKPKYYCLYDQIFHTTHIDSVKELINTLPNTSFFLRTKAYNRLNRNNIKSENIYFQNCNLYQYDDFIRVDMVKNMTAPTNVVLGCIQTAIYMGFKEIYLLGCDFNSFASNHIQHFYDQGESPLRSNSLGFELKWYSMTSYYHYALERYSRKKGIRIYNITPDSLLDAYEFKDLHEIL